MRAFSSYSQMIRKYGLMIFALIFFSRAEAQKEVQLSQFYFNQLLFNPAAAGKGNQTQAGLVYRSQYTGYKPSNIDKGGGATSQLLTASIPFGNFGVGINVLNDKIGALSQQDLQISAAYRLGLGGGTLAIGARAGIYRQAMDYDQLRPEFPDIDDPIFQTGVVSEIQPDFSLGLHFESDQYYIGASAAHLTQPKFKLGSSAAENPLSMVYYLNAGAYISAGYSLEVQPMVLARMTTGALSVEGGALLTFDQRVFAGVTYRHEDVIAIAHAGTYLLPNRSLRLSGSFDIVRGGNKAKSPMSYEVMLSYVFGQQQRGQKSIIRTPRFRF